MSPIKGGWPPLEGFGITSTAVTQSEEQEGRPTCWTDGNLTFHHEENSFGKAFVVTVAAAQPTLLLLPWRRLHTSLSLNVGEILHPLLFPAPVP